MTTQALGLQGTTNGVVTEQRAGLGLAVVAFGLSVACTYSAVGTVSGSTNFLVVGAASVMVQALLTWLESPIWRFNLNLLSVVSLAVDTLINATGLEPFVGRIDKTDQYHFLEKLFGFKYTFSEQTTSIFSLIAGLIVAALPEAILYTSFGRKGE